MSFSNKTVLVTGGSSGIGASIAILFSQHGANVAIVGRNEIRLHEAAEKCARPPLIIVADITIESDVKRIVEDTTQTFGGLDVLVNNAGILRLSSVTDENILETYDDIMSTNLRAVVHLTNASVPHLIRSKGNIVNISSIAGEFVAPTWLLYSVSKAALNQYSKATAMELAGRGVRVNTISPGPVRTDILQHAGLDTPWEVYASNLPLGKIGEPEEIADLVIFLAGDTGRSITGVNYAIDNGMLVK